MWVPVLLAAVFALALVVQHRYHRALLRRYTKLFDRNVAGLYRADAAGVFLEVNDALAKMCGVPAGELVGRRIRDFLHDPDGFRATVEPPRDSGTVPKRTFRLRRSDGTLAWVAGNAFLVTVSGSEVEIEGTLIEITDLKHAEETIQLLANAVESTRDMITITGLDDRITFANQAFLEEYGFTAEEILGAHVSAIDSPDNPPAVRQSIFEGTRKGAWSGELLNRRRDGSEFPIALSTSQIRDRNGEVLGLVGVATNITEKKRTEERVQHEAYHDGLTSLPNRRLFIDRLTVALGQAHRHALPLAVMFIDVDRFKRINDTLGHQAGDELLVEAASRLRQIVRAGDTMARVGGDEFMFLAPDLDDPADASRLAAKVMEAFAQPYVLDGHELFVTASIGVALHPADGTDAETLIKNADLAMYRAKELGRNRFEFSSPAMRAEMALDSLHLENDLRRAVQRGEIFPFYQAQVSLHTGEIVAAEALLRWLHPERGLLAAERFIHIAEEANLIGEIGEPVLRLAVVQLRSWQREISCELRLAVNISARQFTDERLPAILRGALEESGVDPATLELEITETVAMIDIEQTIRILAEVKELGVRVALDDFGAGHSSLNYLKNFRVDTVKIDRGFVRDLTTDVQDAEITSSIIGMARRLGLTTVAEGVETEEQRRILREFGCDQIQGHLVHVPMPAAEFSAWCTARAAPEPRLPTSRAGGPSLQVE